MAQIRNEIRVAVLPFEILSTKKGISPLVLGFTDDLIANFSRFIGLSVISQYSSQQIKDTDNEKDQLRADYLVLGSFRLLGKNARINVQLIRAKDKSVVFAKQFKDSLENILEMQDDITEQIVSILQKQIDYDILSFSYKKKNIELAAYENWVMGMHYLKNGTISNDIKARNCFEEALKIDPHFARAYSGISLSYFNEWSCQVWDRWDVNKKGAHNFALKALEYDENDYISLAVLGRTYLYAEEYEKAEHYVRKSIRMNPNDADNLVQVAFSLMYLGYAAESVKLYEKARELNPLHQDGYLSYGSNFYFEDGNFEKCIELGKKINMQKTWVDFPAYMAAAYFHISDFENMNIMWKLYLERFQNHIVKIKETNEKEALKWHININPYKEKTNLKEFWEKISSGADIKSLITNQKAESFDIASFVKNGEMWELTFQGKSIFVKDNKGNHDLAKLLAEPEREFLCTELMGVAIEDFNGISLIDQKAKSNYQQKIRQLQSEISEAEKLNNPIEANQLREEYENLLDNLSNSLGLSGKSRRSGSIAEKARSAVTWRIRNAIVKIETAHPKLGNHLSKSIKTGTFCSYKPENLIDWQL